VSASSLRDSERPVVAVDCNGSDLGPAEVAAGARLAVEQGARVILFGPAEELGTTEDHVEVVHAPVSIAKSPDPVRAVRAHPEASVVQCARSLSEDRAQAFVCAGATGVALAAGLFHIKRARGIYRPALALTLPVPGQPVTLLDVGANTEARREHLVQFAFMGAALVGAVFSSSKPRVGLLSNGREDTRGSQLILETHSQLAELQSAAGAFEFVGNLEGDDLLSGTADVVVTDGLTGNIALKLIEAVSQTVIGAVRDAAMSSTRAKLGGALLRPALRSFATQIDPEAQGGAYLLGLRGLGVIPHGRFTRQGFSQAILRAQRGAQAQLTAHTNQALADAGALRTAPASAKDASLPANL